MSRSAVDAHEARKALVNIAVRTGDETTVCEEWESLVRLTSILIAAANTIVVERVKGEM